MKIHARSLIIPAALLALCAVSFGLLIPSLGFYWDDWPSLVIDRLQGPQGFEAFFRLDRPTTYVSYVLLMPLLGTNPAAWQIFTLLLRWLTAVLVWWALRKLWLDSGSLPLWTACLFAVHPVFRQQPVALTYHQLWMEFAFYVLSIGAMIAAVRSPRRAAAWTAVGVGALALNFLISEYFLGVELLRPVILWAAVRSCAGQQGFWQTLKSTVLRYLPYAAALLAYLSWRFFFLDLPGEDRNSLVLLAAIQENPLRGLLSLAQAAVQDTIHILVSSWYTTFQPNLFDLENRFSLFAYAVGLAAAALLVVFLARVSSDGPEISETVLQRAKIGLLLGVLLVIFAPLPGWATGRQVTIGAWSDRLAVPAMFGASLALSCLTAWLVRGRWQQIVIIGLLVGLAISSNIRVANDYRWARIQQNRFYWQLYWRAPNIAPQTAVYAEAEVLPKTGLYSTAAGINLIYAKSTPTGALPYWFYSLSREYSHRMYELLGGMPLETKFRQFTFNGTGTDGFIVYYEPSAADCLRVPVPQDASDPGLPAVVKQALPITNLSRITMQAPAPAPLPSIFGEEPERGWCYLFQKADLARQNVDWQQVAALAEEARSQGYSLENSQSNTPQEWLPFLEGYARGGDWQQAVEISNAILEKEPKMSQRLCDLWSQLGSLEGGQVSAASMRQNLNCAP